MSALEDLAALAASIVAIVAPILVVVVIVAFVLVVARVLARRRPVRPAAEEHPTGSSSRSTDSATRVAYTWGTQALPARAGGRMDVDGVRILLVDASDVARSLVRLALAGEYDVDEARNGADALLALSERRYACMVVDVALPDMTGHELLSMVRRTAGDAGMGVVMIAEASDESPDSRRARADAWLRKPLHPKALMDTMRRLVGPSPAVRETPIPGAHALLEALPYPAMVLDAEHRVWLANGSFYEATGRGIDGCFVDCGSAMHGPDGVPERLPARGVEADRRTGRARAGHPAARPAACVGVPAAVADARRDANVPPLHHARGRPSTVTRGARTPSSGGSA